MERVKHKIVLDVAKLEPQIDITIRKGDSDSRVFEFSFKSNSKQYVVGDDCSVIFRAKKPDGTVLFNYCEIINGVAVYTLTSQTSAVEGVLSAQVELLDSQGKVLYAPQFRVIVEDVVYSDNEIESESEKTFITENVAIITSAKNQVRADKNDIDARVTEAETVLSEIEELSEKASEDLEEAIAIEASVTSKAETVEADRIRAERAATSAELDANTAFNAKGIAVEAAEIASSAKTVATEASSSASASAITATNASESARDSASKAEASEQIVADNTRAALEASAQAQTSALWAKSYTEGGTGLRPDESESNSKYYYETIKSIATGSVTGVKGDKEEKYRSGAVNLTPADIGALPEETFIPSQASDVHALPDNTFIPSTASDVGALPSNTTAHDIGALATNDIADWAKASNKPSYNATEVAYDDGTVAGSIEELDNRVVTIDGKVDTISETLNRNGYGEQSGGKNLWDERWIKGYKVSTSDGHVYADAASACSDFLPIIGEQYYCISGLGIEFSSYVAYFDENKVYLGRTGISKRDEIVAHSDNAKLIRIGLGGITNIDDVDKLKVILNEGDSALPYEPYFPSNKMLWKKQYDIDSLNNLGWVVPKELKEVGLFNYTDDSGVFRQIIERVDLGTLAYGYTADWNGKGAFSVAIPGSKAPTSNANVVNAYCTEYRTISRDDNYNLVQDKCMHCTAGNAWGFRNFAYTDKALFAQAMRGIYLYYELAEEITMSGYDNNAFDAVDITNEFIYRSSLTYDWDVSNTRFYKMGKLIIAQGRIVANSDISIGSSSTPIIWTVPANYKPMVTQIIVLNSSVTITDKAVMYLDGYDTTNNRITLRPSSIIKQGSHTFNLVWIAPKA